MDGTFLVAILSGAALMALVIGRALVAKGVNAATANGALLLAVGTIFTVLAVAVALDM